MSIIRFVENRIIPYERYNMANRSIHNYLLFPFDINASEFIAYVLDDCPHCLVPFRFSDLYIIGTTSV